MAFSPPFSRVFPATFDRRAAAAAAGNGLLNALVAYWPGDEASGNLLDAHSNALHLTDTNTVTSAAGLVYATARQHVKASSEYFGRSGDSAFNQDADWSFATWIRHDDISQQTVYQSTGNANLLAQVIFNTYSANKQTFIMFTSAGGNAQVHCTNYGDIPATTWYSLVVTYTAATRAMTLSINAGTRNTGTLGAAPRISASSLTINLGFSPGRGLNGRMGPTAFWERALSTADETAWYNGGAGLAYTALTA